MAEQKTEVLTPYRVRICASNRETAERTVEAVSEIEAAQQGLTQWAETAHATLTGVTVGDGNVTAQAHAMPGFLFYGGRDYADVSARVTE